MVVAIKFHFGEVSADTSEAIMRTLRDKGSAGGIHPCRKLLHIEAGEFVVLQSAQSVTAIVVILGWLTKPGRQKVVCDLFELGLGRGTAQQNCGNECRGGGPKEVPWILLQ